jgi:hypothetical protein
MLTWLSIVCLLLGLGLGLSLSLLLCLLNSEELLLVLEILRLTMRHLLRKMHHRSHSWVPLHCGHLSGIDSLCAIRHRYREAMLLLLLLLLLLLMLLLLLKHHSLPH